MNRSREILVLSLWVCAVGAAWADDMFPPDWRGNYGTVTAAWDYWGAEGMGPRALLQTEAQLVQANPGGFPEPFPAWAYFDSGVYNHSELWGRPGVLEVFEDGTLSFRLSNYPGGPEKWMLIQITFRPGYGAPMSFGVGSFDTDPGQPPWPLPDTTAAVVIDSYAHPDGWQTNSYGIFLEPNPRLEGFSIHFTQYEAFVDQVVIDTWCVPEPGTATGLAVGLLAFASRRR